MAENCYILSVCILLFMKSVGLYEGMFAFNLLMVTGLTLFLVKIALTKHTRREYLFIAALLVLALIVNHMTGEKGLLLYFAVALGVKDTDIERVFFYGACTFVTGFVATVTLSLCGVIPDVVLLHPKHFFGEVLCHSLGYPHPNVLHTTFLTVCVFVLYCLREKGKWQVVAACILLGLNFLVFSFSYSFTGCITCVCYIVFHLAAVTLDRRKGAIGKKEGIALQCVYPGFLLLSIAGPLTIKGRAFEIINNLLNTRFMLSRYYMTEKPFTPFGTVFTVPEGSNYTIDSSYIYALMQIGYVSFLLLTVWYLLTIRSLVQKSRRAALALVFGIALAGLTEPLMFNSSMKNLAFLFLGEYAYSKL